LAAPFDVGPRSNPIQPSLAPQYAVYFLAGLVIGARGLDCGFFRSDGVLVRRWAVWLGGSFTAFLLWVIPAALIEKGGGEAPRMLMMAREVGVILFAGGACFATVAFFIRFVSLRRQIFCSISENAYGIYLFHYVFVIWTQYSLLQIPMPAIIKGAIVLSVTIVLSWIAAVAVSSIPIGARLMRGERRTSMAGALVRKSELA
jgi:glucans biosynthesis protein C